MKKVKQHVMQVQLTRPFAGLLVGLALAACGGDPASTQSQGEASPSQTGQAPSTSAASGSAGSGTAASKPAGMGSTGAATGTSTSTNTAASKPATAGAAGTAAATTTTAASPGQQLVAAETLPARRAWPRQGRPGMRLGAQLVAAMPSPPKAQRRLAIRQT